MSNNAKDVCYEYFDCKEYDCIRRENLSKNCWDIDDVKCQIHSKDFEKIKSLFNTKIEACKLCIFYQMRNQ